MDFNRAKLLYRLISRNQRLADRRHPMFERNMVMKVFIYIFVAAWAVYLFCLGIIFFFIFKDSNLDAYDWINGGMVYFLAIDFFLRFGLQETPAQDVRPYKLLNIPTNFLLNVFLLRLGLRAYNAFWFFFLVPFAFLAVPPLFGFSGFIGFLLGWWLMFVFNSYWYLIWRTFINQRVYTVVIPILVYVALIYFGIFFDEHSQWLFYATLHLGREFIELNPLSFVLVFAAIVLMFFLNRKIQLHYVYKEISKDDKVKKVKSQEMKFLNRFGEIGEYIKLEIKSTVRNQVVRKQFLFGAFYMFMLCALFAFSDVYDDSPFMKIFICIYCFACLGTMTLTNIMCMEGNYMDGLMSRKESVFSLLKAKYYFNCMMMIFPLCSVIMPIVEDKLTVVTALGCMFFSTGVIFPFLFQLAVYNNNTIHLNEKLTRSGRSTKAQMIFSSVALFVPMGFMYMLMLILSESVASIVMLVIGVAGTFLHSVWLRHIYRRFMKRRYVNMAGFRDSRQL